MGAPTKYKPEFNEQVEKFCKLGATNEQIADFLNVSVATVKNWLNQEEEFLASVKKGRMFADANVAEALYQRAIGYKHKETKLFHYQGEIVTTEVVTCYPPDTAAAFIWLRNRQPKLWKQQPEVVHHEHTVKDLKLVKASEYVAQMEVHKKVG